MATSTRHFNKTRIAPTPSGYLHLGNAMSFALTAALARKTGAKILLRIDDMDQQRVEIDYVQDIFDTLDFLNIPWDEGPRNVAEYQSEWSQLHRLGLYNETLRQLEYQREVFACQCSRAQLKGDNYPGTCRNRSLPLDTPNVNWRLYTDERELFIRSFNDSTLKTSLPDEMKDMVVKKKDDHPAYQLTSLVDDLYFGVDLVVRGQDLYPSTIAQHYLADVLHKAAFQNVTFYHHALLMENDDKKLSKSAGATAVKAQRDQGKTAGDIYSDIGQMLGLSKTLKKFRDLIDLV